MQFFLNNKLLQKFLDVEMEVGKPERKYLGVGVRIILRPNVKKLARDLDFSASE
jgi:hypothetical protein